MLFCPQPRPVINQQYSSIHSKRRFNYRCTILVNPFQNIFSIRVRLGEASLAITYCSLSQWIDIGIGLKISARL